MAFKVKFTLHARQDLKESVAYLHRHSPQSALKWLHELKELKGTLAVFPSRFSKVTHTDALRYDYRIALHYSHKVIFYIDGENNTVHIVRIYHSARKPLESDDEIK